MPKDDLSDLSQPRTNQARGSTRFRLIAHGIAWGLSLALLAFVVPKVKTIFRDFNVDMPGVTALVLRASHLIVVFALLFPVLLGSDWFVLNALSRRGEVSLSRVWSAFMMTSPLILIALTLWALILPFLTMDNGRLGG